MVHSLTLALPCNGSSILSETFAFTIARDARCSRFEIQQRSLPIFRVACLPACSQPLLCSSRVRPSRLSGPNLQRRVKLKYRNVILARCRRYRSQYEPPIIFGSAFQTHTASKDTKRRTKVQIQLLNYTSASRIFGKMTTVAHSVESPNIKYQR